MTDTVAICLTCHRTDAFSPGAINHDWEWHKKINEINRPKVIERVGRLNNEVVSSPYWREEKEDLKKKGEIILRRLTKK